MFSVSVACVKCEKIRLLSGSGFTLRNSWSKNCFASSGSCGGPVMVVGVNHEVCVVLTVQATITVQTFVCREMVG